MYKKVALLAAITIPAFATSAIADDVEDTMAVTAQITGTCNVTVTSDMAFGTFDSLTSTVVDADGTADVECSAGIPYVIGLDTGQNIGRRMTDGAGNFLDYEVYTDASHTPGNEFPQVGGSTFGGTGAGIGTLVPYTFYGRIPSQSPTPPAGNYSDTLTVTVRY